MQVLNYKCPGCGAPLTFSSEMQQMHCASCDNTFTAEQLEQYNDMLQKAAPETNFEWQSTVGETQEQLGEMTAYICPSCGAEIVGDNTTAATECMYCGNPAVLTKQVSGIYKPDCVIPFKLNKEAAKKALLNFYKGKPLLPKMFKEENHIEKLSGVYVPFWLFDCGANANMVFDATRINTWSDGSYRYTKTMHYSILRAGSLEFEKIPTDASKKMDDSYMDAIEPFNYSDLVPFSTAYLSGYFADKYDVSAQENTPRANNRVTNTTVDMFRSTVNGYGSVTLRDSNIQLINGQVKYAMMPVWMLNTKYKGKMYNFAMNGQTGRLVGKLPIDKGRLIAWLLGITLGCTALGQIALLFI